MQRWIRASWVGVVAALLVLAPQVAFAQRRVQVNVSSTPQGATVRLDSETSNPIGTTPLTRFRMPSGPHTLYLQLTGYMPGRLDITVARRNETFTAQLTQAGSVYVSADVDGAQIFMDGNAVGTTPGRINNVQPGQHIIEIRQTGMQPFRETVTVGAGSVASVNASLRPPPPQTPPTGTVRVIVSNPGGAVPSDMSVTFDGSPMTGTPPAVSDAQPGSHIVQVSANGFRSVRREVTVTAGQSVALAIDLEAVQVAPTGGSLRVLLQTQGAQAFLDGELLEGTPPQRANVPAGTHVLRVTAPGRTAVQREVPITAGQASTVAINDTDLTVAGGRLVVRSNTPNASVFLDGRNMGPSPYERTDMPPGEHEVRVSAQGHDDRTQTCTVSATQACDLTLNLTRTVGRGAIHVELARPIRGSARLIIDGEDTGEVGAGRDVPNLTAAAHEIRVRADNYADYVESLTLQQGENRRLLVTLRRNRRGPSGTELAARRTAISTWGASPLSRGDAAVDIGIGYGAYPAEVRGTIGLPGVGPAGFDVGFGLRTMLFFNELELRARAGLRAFDGLVTFGGELDFFGGLSTAGGGNVGMRAFLMLSLHTLALAPDEGGDDDDAGQRERANSAGSFAFSLRFGFEALRDGLNGQFYGNTMSGSPRPAFDACNSFAPSMTGSGVARPMPAMGTTYGPCGLQFRTPPTMGSAMNDIVVQDGAEALIRTLIGFRAEIGLSRHWNLFGGLDLAPFAIGTTLPTPTNAMMMPNQPNTTPTRRAIYQIMWFGNDPAVAISLGATYKF